MMTMMMKMKMKKDIRLQRHRSIIVAMKLFSMVCIIRVTFHDFVKLIYLFFNIKSNKAEPEESMKQTQKMKMKKKYAPQTSFSLAGNYLLVKEKKVNYVILHLNSIRVLPINLSLLKVP